ncbi:Vgb family protein [Sorangium sp. So ce117]|uniref:Vgb family protein n=1 Tax=Sorangium sp. So ce117 TaxID=3133277 RepID=UPI003F613B7E
MKRLSWVLLAALVSVGCGGNDDNPSEAGSGGDGGGGGAGDGAACEAGGEGTLDVEIVSPNDAGDVAVTSPGVPDERVVSSASLDTPAGEYTLRAGSVADYPEDERVGFVYRPEDPEQSACVADGATTEVTFNYELAPGSHKLWFTAQNGDQLVGALDGEALLESGEVTPSVAFQGSAEIINQGAIAFDGAGNLWVSANAGQITVRLVDTLGESSEAAPDRVLDVSEACADVTPCAAGGMAFDAAGNLWVGIRDHLLRIDAADLEGSGVVEPSVTITGEEIENVQALAFDESGNLWVASAEQDAVLMYAAGRLAADDVDPADVVLTALTPEPVIVPLGHPTGLAFDEQGALWVGYWGSNTIAKFEPGDLEASAELTPGVQLEVGVLALPESIAFDQQGNLWMPSKVGSAAAIAKAELAAGGEVEAGASVLTSEAFGSLIDLAFNPPPDWSPIYGPQ